MVCVKENNKSLWNQDVLVNQIFWNNSDQGGK